MGQSQPQLVSSHRNSSQPQDRISRNSYPAAGTRVNRRMESATIRIQLPELGYPQDRISRSCNKPQLNFQWKFGVIEVNFSFKTVEVNDHEGISGVHIFLFMCLS